MLKEEHITKIKIKKIKKKIDFIYFIIFSKNKLMPIGSNPKYNSH
jgi:hypothetical protein